MGAFDNLIPDDGKSGGSDNAFANLIPGGGQKDEYADWTPEMRAQYQRAKTGPGSSGMAHERRLLQSATFGGLDEVDAAQNYLFSKLRGEDTSWEQQRAIARRLRDESQKETDGPVGTAEDIAGAFSSMGPGRTAAGAIAQVPGVAESSNFLVRNANRAYQLAKGGAIYGGASAPLQADGDLTERLEAIPEGAYDGAKTALEFGGILHGGLGVKNRMAAAREAHVAAREPLATDFDQSNVPAFGPAVSGSASSQATARGLGNTVVGGPVRRAAGASVDAAERRVQDTLADVGGTQEAGTAGANIQGALRRNLTERSMPGEEVHNLDAPDLHNLASGIEPQAAPDNANPNPNRGQTYPTAFDAAYTQMERNMPTVQRNPLGVRREVAQRPAKRYAPKEPIDPADASAVEQMWEYNRQVGRQPKPQNLTEWLRSIGGVKDQSGEVSYLIGAANQRPGLINNKNGINLDDAALRAHEEGFINTAGRPTVREFLDHLHDDLHHGSVVRVHDQDALDNFRHARDMAADLDKLGVLNAKNADEVRAILQKNRNTERVVQPRQIAPGLLRKTRTERTIEAFATEARQAQQLPGYKGDIYDDNGNLRADVRSHLNQRLGKDIGDRFADLGERRALGRFPPATGGIRELRTAIRKKIEALRADRDTPVDVRNRMESSLTRIYGALTEDMHSFLRAQGPRGVASSGEMAALDERYRQHMEGMRQQLGDLYGHSVEPVQAMDRLARAARDGDMPTLEAFSRVLREKGIRGQPRGYAGASVVQHMLRGARTQGAQGFLDTYGALSPEVRRHLFADSPDTRIALDQLERVARSLQPYFHMTQERGFDATRLGDIATGLGVWFEPVTALATLGSFGALSRFMASPRYVRLLTAAPRFLDNSTSRSKLIGRLAAAVSADPKHNADDDKIVQAARKTWGAPMKLGGPKGPDQLTPGQAVLNYVKHSVPRQLKAAGRMIKGVAEPVERLFGNGGQEFFKGPQDPQAADDMRTTLRNTGLGQAGLEVPEAAGALGSFIGRRGAETLAERGSPEAVKMLDLAEKLSQKGMPDHQITEHINDIMERNASDLGGVSRGRDGQWRVELDDSQSTYGHPGKYGISTMGQALDHPQLYDAYPEMESALLEHSTGKGGSFDPNSDTFSVGMRGDAHSTALHEAQHYIQNKEGFEPGTNPAHELFKGGHSMSLEDAQARYLTNAGEVEARNVSNRMAKDASERRAVPPEFTQDFPNSLQVLRDDGNPNKVLAEAAPHLMWSKTEKQQFSDLLANGSSLREAGTEMGLTLKQARRAADGLGLKSSATGEKTLLAPKDHAEFQKMWEGGKSYAEIGKRFGITPKAAQVTRARLGLEARPTGKPPLQAGTGTIRRKADTALDRRAIGTENELRQFEDNLRKGGADDERIAANINKRFKANVTADDIKNRNVWWRVGEGRASRDVREYHEAGASERKQAIDEWGDGLNRYGR